MEQHDIGESLFFFSKHDYQNQQRNQHREQWAIHLVHIGSIARTADDENGRAE
jgi:hypothetical protein